MGLNGNVIMNAEDLSRNMTVFANIHNQSIRNLHITVEVLDDDDRVVDTIAGHAIDGENNIDGISLIRRTGTIGFSLLERFLPSSDSILWMTNKIRVYAGLENLASDRREVTHFLLGTYYIAESSSQIDSLTRVVNLTLEDYMMRWDNTPLEFTLQIENETDGRLMFLHEAVRAVMHTFGEYNLNIEESELTIPHRLEFMSDETVMTVIERLRDLYMDWVCYYDAEGAFHFRRLDIQNKNAMTPIWRFEHLSDLRIVSQHIFNYRDVRNRVTVHGGIGTRDEGVSDVVAPFGGAKIGYEGSPFHESRIGEKLKVVNDPDLRTQAQCVAMAMFTLFQSSENLERITVETAPIYFLDAGHVVEIPVGNGEYDRYIIETMSVGLSIEGTMTIEARKLRFDTWMIEEHDPTPTTSNFKRKVLT